VKLGGEVGRVTLECEWGTTPDEIAQPVDRPLDDFFIEYLPSQHSGKRF
jgi:hypothetical protein